jgi:hypothetical protein
MLSARDQQMAEAIKGRDLDLFSRRLAIAEVNQGHPNLLFLRCQNA